MCGKRYKGKTTTISFERSSSRFFDYTSRKHQHSRPRANEYFRSDFVAGAWGVKHGLYKKEVTEDLMFLHWEAEWKEKRCLNCKTFCSESAMKLFWQDLCEDHFVKHHGKTAVNQDTHTCSTYVIAKMGTGKKKGVTPYSPGRRKMEWGREPFPVTLLGDRAQILARKSNPIEHQSLFIITALELVPIFLHN